MEYRGRNGEYFAVIDITADNLHLLQESRRSELSILWFESDNNRLQIDAVEHSFHRDELVFLTEFHQVEMTELGKLRLLRFNRPFYCILDHDSEVGCKGVLYFGASSLPFIRPEGEDLEILKAVWKMLGLEMASRDHLQLEMLQMMLKRILILCTRIYKDQSKFHDLEQPNVDLVREFNFLVEMHFREKHQVAEYASLLNRSPKTLSNVFKQLADRSPLQFIQERRMLEARRILYYTDRSVSEVGYELGFTDVQAFSRFFKKQGGVSPSDFRNREILPHPQE